VTGQSLETLQNAYLPPIQQASNQDDMDSALAQAEALLRSVGGAGAGSGRAPSNEMRRDMDQLAAAGFVCDESGCVLKFPESEQDESLAEVNMMLRGKGWSLGMLE
jgi:hypothetical protein